MGNGEGDGEQGRHLAGYSDFLAPTARLFPALSLVACSLPRFNQAQGKQPGVLFGYFLLMQMSVWAPGNQAF